MVASHGGARVVPDFGPLAGVRVLDSGRYVAGPWASTHLGEFGAEIVHVEGPPFGPPYADPTRSLPPLLPPGAQGEQAVSESWVQYSRNKLSVGLDVRRPEGREVFLDLAAASEIWIESSRPGTYANLGLADSVLWARNPRLTIVHVSGFGQTGDPSRVAAPSYDLIGQAYSGYLSLQGDPEPAPPMRAGTALNDTVTGLAAAGAALMGYIGAQRTGQGQAVDVAQYETFFVLLENLALDYFARGEIRGRYGRGHARLFPYDIYRARDDWVVIAAPTQDAWIRLRALLAEADRSWDDPDTRRAQREEVNRVIGAWCANFSVDQLRALAKEHDLAISPVYDAAAIARDPHYRARDMFLEWTDPVAGPVKGAGVAPKFSRTPGGVWRGAPWLGQDNEAVLSTILGYPAEKVGRLRRDGVIGEHPPTDAPARPVPFYVREGL